MNQSNAGSANALYVVGFGQMAISLGILAFTYWGLANTSGPGAGMGLIILGPLCLLVLFLLFAVPFFLAGKFWAWRVLTFGNGLWIFFGGCLFVLGFAENIRLLWLHPVDTLLDTLLSVGIPSGMLYGLFRPSVVNNFPVKREW